MALGSATAVLLELSGARNSGLLTLATYTVGYLVAVAALGLLLMGVGLGSGANQTSQAGIGLAQGRLRWLAALVVFNMAGLPPFFFFMCKLGLLCLVLGTSAGLGVAIVASYVFGGWVVYFCFIRSLLQTTQLSATTGAVRVQPLALYPSCWVVLGVVLVGGLLLFEEVCFWAML